MTINQARPTMSLHFPSNDNNNNHVISGCHLCAAEDRTRVLVSSAKLPSPARNAFVCSSIHKTRSSLAIHVYLEMSSRDHLVATNERVRLQRDIVFGVLFGGDPGFPRLVQE